MFELEKSLLWVSRASIFLLTIIPLIVTSSMIFPFVSGKNFFFRFVMGIGVASWVALAILNAKYRPQRQPIIIALSVFFVVVGLATAFGADPYHSFWSNFERMEGSLTYIYLFGLFLVTAATFNTKKLWLQLFVASIAVSVISAIWGLLQSTGVIAMVAPGRPYAGFGNSIYLAVYLLFHIFVLGLVCMRVTIPQQRILAGLVLLLECYVFALSASRGAFLGALAGAVSITLLMAIYYRSKRALIGFGVAMGIVITVFSLIIAFPDSPIVENVTLLNRLSEIPFSDITRDPRVMIWGIGWDAFLERPLLGWGPGNFILPFAEFYNPNLFGQEPWFDRTHNMFIEWLVATGITGFLAYLALIMTSFWTIFRSCKQEKIDITTGIFFAGFLVTYLVQNIFIFDTIGTYIVIFLFFALLYAVNNFDEEQKVTSFSMPSSVKIFGAALAGTTVIIFTLMMNAKPMLASQHLIDGLHAFPERLPAEKVIERFDKALALDTFADTEIRERFASVVFELSRDLNQFTPQFFVITNKAIEYSTQENVERPNQLRGLLFLAQLESIKATASDQDFARAEELLNEAVLRAPRYVQTRLSLSNLYLIQGKNDDALRQVKEIEKLDIRIMSIISPILRAYIRADDPKGAEEFLEKFFAMDPYGAINRNDLNAGLIDASERFAPKEQLSFFLKLDNFWTEGGSDKVILYLLIAQAYGESGDFDSAIEYANKAQQFESPYSEQIESFLKSIEALRG